MRNSYCTFITKEEEAPLFEMALQQLGLEFTKQFYQANNAVNFSVEYHYPDDLFVLGRKFQLLIVQNS